MGAPHLYAAPLAEDASQPHAADEARVGWVTDVVLQGRKEERKKAKEGRYSRSNGTWLVTVGTHIIEQAPAAGRASPWQHAVVPRRSSDQSRLTLYGTKPGCLLQACASFTIS